MFTGIIEDLGTVKKITDQQLSVTTKLDDIKTGDSMAVNGICLTVSKVNKLSGSWVISFDISPETSKKTNLAELKPGDRVNLERALKLGDRLGGHFITGHVEGIGKILAMRPFILIKSGFQGDPNEVGVIFEFSSPENISKYLVPKGSIAVDGISLTIVDVNPLPITNYQLPTFTVSAIPYTLQNTTLGLKKVGATVNLEPDILAKYAENILEIKKTKKEITLDFLKETGF